MRKTSIVFLATILFLMAYIRAQYGSKKLQSVKCKVKNEPKTNELSLQEGLISTQAK